MNHYIPDTDSPLIRFLRSLVRRKPKPGHAGQSAKPKLLHKSLTLRRSHGPGSYAEHDQLVRIIGAVAARRIERLGPRAVHDCLCDSDPVSFAKEAA